MATKKPAPKVPAPKKKVKAEEVEVKAKKPAAKKAVKVEAEEVEDAPKSLVKGKAKKEAKEKIDDFSFNLMQDDLDMDNIITAIENSIGLNQLDVKANKITTSTGLLSLDLMLSGGLVTGGWYTFFGGEQSCKSTLVSTQLANAIPAKIPHLMYFDYEGSFQAEYFLSIARHVGVIPPKMKDHEASQRIFGLQDDKGNWVIRPRIRYYQMSIGEKFFDYVARLLRQLPDKLYKEGKWWLVYDPENKAHKDKMKKSKLEHNELYWKKTGKWWVETDNGLPQALVITDSYPAMNPEKMDVDDPSGAMAVQARMFSDNIKRIKGKMGAKRVTVMGINQLRKAPAVQFGNPEYEPCFIGSTPVLLADGSYKTIEEIVLNKLEVNVTTLDIESNEIVIRPVIDWKQNGTVPESDLIDINYVAVSHTTPTTLDEVTVTATKNHKFYTKRGWVEAKDLVKTDVVYLGTNAKDIGEGVAKNAIPTNISSVTPRTGDAQIPVYDITVDEHHNYFVGDLENAEGFRATAICVKNCGESLKFNSDVRIRMASRSVQGGSGQFEEEPGVNGGEDQYRYINMRAAKNKLSVPNLEGWARVWVRDAEGQAHGFDPVYDTFYFLKELGLISGTKNRLRIDIPKMKDHKPLTWLNFKKIIVGDAKMVKETLESVGVMKPVQLRKELFKMFEEGTAMKIFFDRKKAASDGKAEKEDSDD